MPTYNSKHIGVRRIRQEMKELFEDKSIMYRAMAQEENIFNWHFVIRGPPDSDFEGGVYCGRIELPPDYPCKPPNIILDTPNGRFRQGEKICLSISAYHPEKWHPAWGVRTILEALISFFPTPGEGAVAALDWPKKDRQLLAKRSHAYNLKNNLYKTLEPLQPATKEEILAAQQRFCEEAKDAATMSVYKPSEKGQSESKAASEAASVDAVSADASSAAAPSPNTSQVRQRSSSVKKQANTQAHSSEAHNEARASSEVQAHTDASEKDRTAPKQGSSCNALTIATCLLLALLVVLLVRKFNKATVM